MNSLSIPQYSKSICLRSYSYLAPRIYNVLPFDLKMMVNIKKFKSTIKNLMKTKDRYMTHQLRKYKQVLFKKFTVNDRYLGEIFPGITNSFYTKIKLAEMANFFKTYPEAGAGMAVTQRASENVRNNIVWLSKYNDTVDEWISYSSS